MMRRRVVVLIAVIAAVCGLGWRAAEAYWPHDVARVGSAYPVYDFRLASPALTCVTPGSSTRVSWNTVPGTQFYRLYWSPSSGINALRLRDRSPNTSTTGYVDIPASEGTTTMRFRNPALLLNSRSATVRVQAWQSATNYSELSNQVSVRDNVTIGLLGGLIHSESCTG